MHKSFYASGFLYNLKTNQILLLQSEQKEGAPAAWSMPGGESKNDEEPQITFQRIVAEQLNLKIKDKDIYPIYDYFHEALNKDNFVFYAEVKSSPAVKSIGKSTLSWVTFSEITKHPFSPHTKQDIIVGERVINAKIREQQAILIQQTPV